MILLSFFRVIKFSLQDFARNFWLSIITVTIILLTLFSIDFIIILNYISNASINFIQDKIDITVYLDSNAKPQDIEGFKNEIKSYAEVKSLNYVNKEAALRDFKAKHKDNRNILKSLEEIGENPLMAHFNIKAKKSEDYPRIIEKLESSSFNNLIFSKNYNDHKKLIAKINEISKKVKNIGYFIMALFSLIAILVIYNTIRIAIYVHREEIHIMKLVGATNWFIKAPYLITGIIYSFLAIIISIIALYPLLGLIQPYLSNFFNKENLNLVSYFNDNFIFIFGLEFSILIVLNIIASSLAVRRYLKVK